MEVNELHQTNIKELRVIAKTLGVKSPTVYSKGELIELITSKQNMEKRLNNISTQEETKSEDQSLKPTEKKHPGRPKKQPSTEEKNETMEEKKRGRKPGAKTQKKAPFVIARTVIDNDNKKEPEITFKKMEPSVIFTGRTTRVEEPEEEKQDLNVKEESVQISESPEEIIEESEDIQEEYSEPEKAEDTPPVKNESVKKHELPGDNDVSGILEVLPDNYGFLRMNNYISGNKDIYVSPVQIKRFSLKTGDKIQGKSRYQKDNEKYQALNFISSVNGLPPDTATRRKPFDKLTPIYTDEKIVI